MEKELAFPARKIRRSLEREGIQLRDPEMERIAAEKAARRRDRRQCRLQLTLQLLDDKEPLFRLSTVTKAVVPAPYPRSVYNKDIDLLVEDRDRMLLLVQRLEQALYQEMYLRTISMDFTVP